MEMAAPPPSIIPVKAKGPIQGNAGRQERHLGANGEDQDIFVVDHLTLSSSPIPTPTTIVPGLDVSPASSDLAVFSPPSPSTSSSPSSYGYFAQKMKRIFGSSSISSPFSRFSLLSPSAPSTPFNASSPAQAGNGSNAVDNGPPTMILPSRRRHPAVDGSSRPVRRATEDGSPCQPSRPAPPASSSQSQQQLDNGRIVESMGPADAFGRHDKAEVQEVASHNTVGAISLDSASADSRVVPERIQRNTQGTGGRARPRRPRVVGIVLDNGCNESPLPHHGDDAAGVGPNFHVVCDGVGSTQESSAPFARALMTAVMIVCMEFSKEREKKTGTAREIVWSEDMRTDLVSTPDGRNTDKLTRNTSLGSLTLFSSGRMWKWRDHESRMMTREGPKGLARQQEGGAAAYTAPQQEEKAKASSFFSTSSLSRVARSIFSTSTRTTNAGGNGAVPSGTRDTQIQSQSRSSRQATANGTGRSETSLTRRHTDTNILDQSPARSADTLVSTRAGNDVSRAGARSSSSPPSVDLMESLSQSLLPRVHMAIENAREKMIRESQTSTNTKANGHKRSGSAGAPTSNNGSSTTPYLSPYITGTSAAPASSTTRGRTNAHADTNGRSYGITSSSPSSIYSYLKGGAARLGGGKGNNGGTSQCPTRSATLSVAYLDVSSRSLLCFTIGDSKTFLVRGETVVFETSSVTYSFNVPSVVSTDIRKNAAKKYLLAENCAIAVMPGDILITCSDGLVDNLFEKEIIECLEKTLGEYMTAKAKSATGSICSEKTVGEGKNGAEKAPETKVQASEMLKESFLQPKAIEEIIRESEQEQEQMQNSSGTAVPQSLAQTMADALAKKAKDYSNRSATVLSTSSLALARSAPKVSASPTRPIAPDSNQDTTECVPSDESPKPPQPNRSLDRANIDDNEKGKKREDALAVLCEREVTETYPFGMEALEQFVERLERQLRFSRTPFSLSNEQWLWWKTRQEMLAFLLARQEEEGRRAGEEEKTDKKGIILEVELEEGKKKEEEQRGSAGSLSTHADRDDENEEDDGGLGAEQVLELAKKVLDRQHKKNGRSLDKSSLSSLSSHMYSLDMLQFFFQQSKGKCDDISVCVTVVSDLLQEAEKVMDRQS